MHSEDPADHKKATEEYRRIARDVYDLAKNEIASEDVYRAKAAQVVQKDVNAANAMAKVSIDFEKKHYDIIKRFGRYPHRNKVVRRESTMEEIEYLEGGGETFDSKA